MPDRIRLDGKVAVVTGAAGVIGTATIRLLAERGARIVAVDRREADLKSAIRDLPASAQPLAVTADVTLEDEVADYVRAATDKFGTIDVFYNNAGIEGEIKSIPDYPLENRPLPVPPAAAPPAQPAPKDVRLPRYVHPANRKPGEA